MRIARAIVFWVGSVLTFVVSLALAFVEARTLFAGDWKLAEHPGLAATGYALRAVFFLVAIAFCVIAVINEVRKKGPLPFGLRMIPIFLALGAGASFLFYQWFVSLAILVGPVLLIVAVETHRTVEKCSRALSNQGLLYK